MRTIDADKLKKNVENAFSWIDNSEEEMLDPELVDFYERVISLIENAPPVEEDKIIQCHSIESKAYVDWFKKGYKEGERTSLDLAKEVIAKFEGYLDEDMIERIQIALEKEIEGK